MTTLFVFIVGGCVGFLAGLFGVGGGLIMVPVLVWSFTALGFSDTILTHMALATSFACIVPTAISAIIVHHKKQAIDVFLVKWLSLAMVLGTALGVVLLADVSGRVLQKIVGIFAFFMSVYMFYQPVVSVQKNILSRKKLMLSGSVIGFVSAWLGIGGGSLTVPYLIRHGLPMKFAVATAAACGLPIAISAVIMYALIGLNHPALPAYSTGFVYWPAVFGITVLSIPFARLGARMAHRWRDVLLKRLFALLLFIVAVKLLWL